jgi:mannitol/fructose-specific phosphotransferase system IIA component (Ntr-type)
VVARPGSGLAAFLCEERILVPLAAADAGGALAALAAALARDVGRGETAERIAREFAEREALGATAPGGGIALPHCRSTAARSPLLALGIHPGGIPFGARDGAPVRAFFAIVSPSDRPGSHLEILAAVSRWARDGDRLAALVAARTPRDVLALVGRLDNRESAA